MNDLRGDKLSFAKTHPVNMSLISLASQPVRETKSFIQTAEIKIAITIIRTLFLQFH